MEYTINKLAGLAGVSTRTLRYYDEIGLLKPKRISNKYRIYGEEEVNLLQQILFFRELGFPLPEIAKIVGSDDFDRRSAMQSHLVMLTARQKQLSLLIENVKKTILKEEGKIEMSDKEKFAGLKEHLLQENEEKYGDEIREKYGEETVEKSNAKFKSMTEEEHQKLEQLSAEIVAKLEAAVRAGISPVSAEGLEIAAIHRDWLTLTWPEYSAAAHRGLGQMYVDDSRFTAYYDSNVPGCAAFLRDAIAEYTKNTES